MAPLQGLSAANHVHCTAGVGPTTPPLIGGSMSLAAYPCVPMAGAPPPAPSQHTFDFNAWDVCWTGSVLHQPITTILAGINKQVISVPGNGHCLFSSRLVCLGLKVTPTAVQQLRELLACHVEQNFNTHLHASMPEVTKFQLPEQLRCFDEVAHPNYWGDANCLLVFTSCYGHGVVVLSVDGDTCHSAFAAASPKMLIVSFNSTKSHYEAVTQAPSTSHRHLEVSAHPTANPSLLH